MSEQASPRDLAVPAHVAGAAPWHCTETSLLLLFIESAVDDATEFAAYESNDERLWQRIEKVVRRVLLTLWRNGALAGVTPDEAFFVNVGRTTMTDRDVRNGRLVIEIGVAPLKPAEFVVLRLFQSAMAPTCRWC
jgi:phage tail sheath protein FI